MKSQLEAFLSPPAAAVAAVIPRLLLLGPGFLPLLADLRRAPLDLGQSLGVWEGTEDGHLVQGEWQSGTK